MFYLPSFQLYIHLLKPRLNDRNLSFILSLKYQLIYKFTYSSRFSLVTYMSSPPGFKGCFWILPKYSTLHTNSRQNVFSTSPSNSRICNSDFYFSGSQSINESIVRFFKKPYSSPRSNFSYTILGNLTSIITLL